MLVYWRFHISISSVLSPVAQRTGTAHQVACQRVPLPLLRWHPPQPAEAHRRSPWLQQFRSCIAALVQCFSQLNMDFADHADPDMCHLDLFWLCLSSEVWHMGHDPTSIIIFTIFHSNLEWLLPRCTVGLKRLKLQPRNSLESIGMQRSPRIHPYWNKSLTVGYKSIV